MHARTHARTHTHLVQWSPAVNRTVLNDFIHSLRDGSSEVGVGKLRVEEDLRSQKPLVAHIHLEGFLGDRVDTIVHLEPLGGVTVVLAKFLGNVRAHIAVGFLHSEGEGRGGGRRGEEGGEGRREERGGGRRGEEVGLRQQNITAFKFYEQYIFKLSVCHS